MRHVKIDGEYYRQYEADDAARMTETWRKWIEEDIHRDWRFRRWGMGPPVGCDHEMSWQMVLLAMMPFVYGLFALVAQFIEGVS